LLKDRSHSRCGGLLLRARTKSGLQIFNLPQVAARLAGGFLYPVTPDILEPAGQGRT